MKPLPPLEKLFAIIHEDADLLVVHKPADLVCHPTKGDEYSSLISRARIYLNLSHASNEAKNVFHGEAFPIQQLATSNQQPSAPHLVNRLDRETSGLVVIAKNAVAARELGQIWETRTVQKEYLAIVHGHVAAEQGIIDTPLGKDECSIIAIKDCVRPDGAPAQTEFFVEKRFHRLLRRDECHESPYPASDGLSQKALSPPPNSETNFPPRSKESTGEDDNDPYEPSSLALQSPPIQHPVSSIQHPFTLLRLLPRTGRKHQIRIHLAHIGHPIVGDKIYGGDPDLYLALVENRLTNAQRSQLILPNHALHAGKLLFNWRGVSYSFNCPPEPFFEKFHK